MLVSIALLISTQRSTTFFQWQTKVASVIAYPFQWTVDTPIRFVRWLGNSMTAQHHLIAETETLRAHTLLLQSRLQKMLVLEKENAQLRRLLQSTPQVAGRVIVARLLAIDLNPNLLQVVVDKGTKNHVYVGQPVLDAYGVMGQVISVGPMTSKILLITDPRSAIPVEDYRNGVRAIAVGSGLSGQLSLIDVPALNKIKSGDLFVTSGLGLRYPIGYPVGVVSKIVPVAGNHASKMIVTPTAHLDQTEQVLLAWPSKDKFFKAVQQQLKIKLPLLKPAREK